ncbi:MAG: DUF3079 domain-containing protein [Pseudomonadota bacterium]
MLPGKKPQRFPLHPKHPERLCWGCDKYCPAENMLCGNGNSRVQHPAELMGDDWYEWDAWGLDAEGSLAKPAAPRPRDATD